MESKNAIANSAPIDTNKGNEASDIHTLTNHDEINDNSLSIKDQPDDPVISFKPEDDETDYEGCYYQPVEQILRPSSSIEAVNLNSWPTSSTETSPEQQKDKLGNYHTFLLMFYRFEYIRAIRNSILKFDTNS